MAHVVSWYDVFALSDRHLPGALLVMAGNSFKHNDCKLVLFIPATAEHNDRQWQMLFDGDIQTAFRSDFEGISTRLVKQMDAHPPA
jgi:hypothetical protein